MKLKGALILALIAAVGMWSCGTKGSLNKKKDRQVFYSAVDGLKLYPAPHFSDNAITELPLNEKVLRYRIEKGFAYVKVQRTGQKGWVENARLKWRVEKQKTPSDQPSPLPQQVKEPAEEAASPEESTSSDSTTKKPDASVLDSF